MEELIEEYMRDSSSLSFQEKLFTYYKESNYSSKFLLNLGIELGLSTAELKKYLYSYAKDILKMNKEEFIEYTRNSKNANAKLFIGKENIILSKYGIKTNFLWTNEREKVMFLEDIYKQSEEHNFDVNFTKKISGEIGIIQKKYLDLLKYYMKEYLKKSDEEILNNSFLNIKQGDQVRINNDNLNNIFRIIINSNSSEDIEKELSESNRHAHQLIADFNLYKKFYSEEEIEKFNKHIEFYREYMKRKADEKNEIKKSEKANEQIEKIKKFLDEYLSSNKVLKEYLEINKMKDYMFNNYLECLKENASEEYNKYTLLLEERRKQEEEYITNCVNAIVDGIKNGYEENGIVRDFDVLDYYFITKLPFLILKRSALPIFKSSELGALKKIEKYRNAAGDRPKEFKTFLEEKLIIGLKQDEEGNIIPDSGRVISNEEKENIFKFITENEIPFNNQTYRAAIRRYTKGLLEFHIPPRQVLKLTNTEATK